jgi:peptide/nickel transport system permease protein
MARFLLRRLLGLIPTLLFLSVFAFVALELAPGDPMMRQMNDEMLAQLTEAQLGQRRADLGLDGPVHERYITWLTGVVQGDWGFSVVTGRPVLDEISSRLAPTAILMGASLLIALVIGIPGGVFAAYKQHSPLDHASTGFSLVMISTPSFVTGLILIYLFALNLGWFPSGGMSTVGAEAGLVDRLRHLVLPSTVLGFVFGSEILRYVRASMLDVLGQDYVTAARAKGLVERTVVGVHAFRNALLPLITLMGLLMPYMVVGAVVTEEVFAWPGMGRLVVRAALQQDPSLMMGVLMVLALAVMAGNVLADIAYGIADPRIRVGAKSEA